MLRITYEKGNGYTCHCCRKVDEYDYDYKTEDEVLDWLIKEYFGAITFPIYEDENDIKLISIEQEIGKDIKDKFLESVPNDLLEKEYERRKNILKEKEDKEKKQEEEVDIRTLKKLIEKYPEQAKNFLKDILDYQFYTNYIKE